MKKVLLVTLLFSSILLFGCIQGAKSVVKDQVNAVESALPGSSSGLSGTYRCFSYNVQGAGKSCTSPPLVLTSDGKYSMSSEQGTYTVNGDVIVLSESKIRGPGKLLEKERQIRFEYEYNGWTHTITYAKFESSEPASNSNAVNSNVKYVEVSLNIVFPSESEARGITTAKLVAQGESQQAGETLVYESRPGVATALFRKSGAKSGIAIGKVYDVLVSNGFGNWKVGEVDLTSVSDDIELELQAVTQSEGVKSETPEEPPQVIAQNEEQNVKNTSSLPICDSNVPKYSQPSCRDE